MAKDDESDTKDEKVDGARIAAQILMRLPKESQARITRTMKETAPAALLNVQKNIVRFEDLADLTPGSIQALLKVIDQRDVVLTLQSAPKEVKSAIFDSVSERRKQVLVEESLSLSEPSPADVENAKRRIAVKLDELREQGKIRTQSNHDTWV